MGKLPKLVVNGRRSAIEIIYDMLSVCRTGEANKTAVMYRSNLSHSQLMRYLVFLNDQGLVEKDRSGKYHLTSKGDQLLDQISEVLDVLSDLQDEGTDRAGAVGTRGATGRPAIRETSGVRRDFRASA